MKNNYHFYFLAFTIFMGCKEDPIGLTFLEAEKKGISFDSLNVIYKSANSLDSTKTVFKTEADMIDGSIAYQNLYDELGKYLKEKGFKWPFATTCFQRIYFNEEGTIDYYLYNFLGEPPYEVTADQEMKFKGILNEFIKNYKFPVKTNGKHSQCGTVVYGLKKDK